MVDKDKFNDDLIDVSGGVAGSGESGGVVDDGTPVANPFAPPPPKDSIFHRDDSPPESERDLWKAPLRNPHNTGVKQDTDYRSPVKPDTSHRIWRKIANHPVVIALAVIAVFAYVLTDNPMPFWLWFPLVVFITPYWLYSRSRYHRYRGGLFFDEDTIPRGCFYRYLHWF